MKQLRTFLLGILMVTVVGCGGSDAPAPVVIPEDTPIELPAAQFKAYETADYRIYHPVSWNVKRDFTTGIGRITDVAFVSNIKEVFFTPTITVSRESLGENVSVSSFDFGQRMIEVNEQSLLNYRLLDRQEFTANGETVIVVLYEGKTEAAANVTEFVQTFMEKDGIGFVVTGARDPSGDTILADRLVDSVKSFRLIAN